MSKKTASLVEDSAAFKEIDVGKDENVAGRNGRNAMFQTKVNVKAGDYFNAAKSELIFQGTDGEVAGMASAHNCEIYLPDKVATSGSYTALECNYNFTASTVLQSAGAPQAIATFKAGGDAVQIAVWEAQANSGALSFQGLTSADGGVFQTEAPGAVDATLKIMVNDTPYWLGLSSAHD